MSAFNMSNLSLYCELPLTFYELPRPAIHPIRRQNNVLTEDAQVFITMGIIRDEPQASKIWPVLADSGRYWSLMLTIHFLK